MEICNKPLEYAMALNVIYKRYFIIIISARESNTENLFKKYNTWNHTQIVYYDQNRKKYIKSQIVFLCMLVSPIENTSTNNVFT